MTLLNLTEWYFKVDFGILWRLKATSPFKRMSHTVSFREIFFKYSNSLCSAYLPVVDPTANFWVGGDLLALETADTAATGKETFIAVLFLADSTSQMFGFFAKKSKNLPPLLPC